jgi:hypothetical protein
MIGVEDFAQAFHLVQKTPAASLAFFAVQVVLVIGTKLQVISHHHRVLEQQEVGCATELFELGQRPRGRRLCSDRDKFPELKVVFFSVFAAEQ